MIVSSKDLVNLSRQNIKEIDVQTFTTTMVQTTCIIDVREPDEYSQGHIAGAVNMPRGVLEMQLASHPSVVKKDAPLEQLAKQNIYLICRSGGRSALAAESMQRMGFDKVYSVSGGMIAWENAGFAAEK